MPERRDALCAAAELILAIENAAKASGAANTVATVGICEVFPGAVNSIPSRVNLTLNIRDKSLDRRDVTMRAIEDTREKIAAERQVNIREELVNADAPAHCAPEIVAALTRACEKHGFASMPMVSRAYHDSLFMSRIAPVACCLFLAATDGATGRMNTPRRKILRAACWCLRRRWLRSLAERNAKQQKSKLETRKSKYEDRKARRQECLCHRDAAWRS